MHTSFKEESIVKQSSYQITSTSTDGQCLVWDLSAQGPCSSPKMEYKADDEFFACTWDRAGQKFVFAGKKGIIYVGTVHTHDCKPLAERTIPVCALAWTPDGKSIASGDRDGSICLWNAQDGQQLRSHAAHQKLVTGLAWSPDGRFLASSSWDGTCKLWRDDGTQVTTLHPDQQSQAFAVTWSPDGRSLAVASDEITLYQMEGERFLRALVYEQHQGVVYGAAWSPNGDYIASTSFDASVHVWAVRGGKRVATYKHDGWVRAVNWSPDGKLVASGGSDMQVHVWEAGTGKNLAVYLAHRGVVHALSWNPVYVVEEESTISTSSLRTDVPSTSGAKVSDQPQPRQVTIAYTPPKYLPPSGVASTEHPSQLHALPPRPPVTISSGTWSSTFPSSAWQVPLSPTARPHPQNTLPHQPTPTPSTTHGQRQANPPPYTSPNLWSQYPPPIPPLPYGFQSPPARRTLPLLFLLLPLFVIVSPALCILFLYGLMVLGLFARIVLPF